MLLPGGCRLDAGSAVVRRAHLLDVVIEVRDGVVKLCSLLLAEFLQAAQELLTHNLILVVEHLLACGCHRDEDAAPVLAVLLLRDESGLHQLVADVRHLLLRDLQALPNLRDGGLFLEAQRHERRELVERYRRCQVAVEVAVDEHERLDEGEGYICGGFRGWRRHDITPLRIV